MPIDDHAGEGAEGGPEVGSLGCSERRQLAEVDHARHGVDDDRAEHRLGQIFEQAGEEEHRERRQSIRR